MAPPFVVVPQNPITANSFVGNTPGPSFAVGPAGMTGLQVSDVTLTSAQLLALFTGAITLIPAPGVGWFLNIDKIVMRLLAGSAAYTDAGGAASGIVGEEGLRAARSRNVGGSAGVLDEAAREKMRTSAGVGLDVATKDAM